MEFQYKGLKQTIEHVPVTPTDIDRYMEKLRAQANMEKGEQYTLDDRFAREYGKCETLAQMRERMGQTLRGYYDERAEADLREQLIRQAAATLDYTPTEAEIEAATQKQLESFRAQLAQRNLTEEAYCSFSGSTLEQLRADIRDDAAQLLRIKAAIEKIAQLEQISVEEKDIADACAELCRLNGITAQQLSEVYDDALAQTVRDRVLTAKVLQFIRDAAAITEA